jgi:hypothetical protein
MAAPRWMSTMTSTDGNNQGREFLDVADDRRAV